MGGLGSPHTWGSPRSAVETDRRNRMVSWLSLHPMWLVSRETFIAQVPVLEFNCRGRRRQEGQLPKGLTRGDVTGKAHN